MTWPVFALVAYLLSLGFVLIVMFRYQSRKLPPPPPQPEWKRLREKHLHKEQGEIDRIAQSMEIIERRLNERQQLERRVGPADRRSETDCRQEESTTEPTTPEPTTNNQQPTTGEESPDND